MSGRTSQREGWRVTMALEDWVKLLPPAEGH